MDRNQTILAKLGLPDVQDAIDEIDIGAIQAERFAGTQAGARQYSDQHRQRHCPLGISGRNATARRHERSELTVAQDARRRDRAGPGKCARIERLGPRVIDSEIFVKATQDPMTNGAAVSRPIPRKDEIERHASGERAIQLLGLHKLRQSAQCGGLLLERVAERAAQSDVALDLLGQYLCEGAHDAPPGKGSATSVSCGTATFTYMAVVSMLR